MEIIDENSFKYLINDIEGDLRKKISLTNISSRNHGVEAHMYDESVLASDRETFENQRDLKTYLFGSNVSKGEIRQIKLFAVNPDSVKQEKTFELETDEHTLLNLLENRSKKMVVPTEDEEVISCNLVGLKNISKSLVLPAHKLKER